jgi:hypothetical protein
VTDQSSSAPFQNSRVVLMYNDFSFTSPVTVLTATTSATGFYSFEFPPDSCDYSYSLYFDGTEDGHTATRSVNITIPEQVIDAAITHR